MFDTWTTGTTPWGTSAIRRMLIAGLVLSMGLAGSTFADGGTVKGVVKFEGRRAERRPIRMNADQYCADFYNGKAEAQRELFVFGNELEDGAAALVNVLVYVSKGLEDTTYEAPATAVEIDQHGCVYVPHVLALQAGQPLDILNNDSTLHNVKMTSANNGAFNESMPVKGMILQKKLSKPEIGVGLKCDVHPWMGAYLHVLAHPFFGVTGEDGSFELSGLPAGQYEISVWHEFDKFTAVTPTVAVTVGEGETKEVAFTYQPPARD